MKKLIAILLTLSMIFAFAACSKVSTGDDETTTNAAGETGEASGEENGSEAEETDADAVVPEERAGEYELLEENNDADKIKKVFDSDYTDSNAVMNIKTDGGFSFAIGSYQASGTVTSDNGDLIAEYTLAETGEAKTSTLEWDSKNSSYTMEAEGVELVWTSMEDNGYLVVEPVTYESVEQYNSMINSQLGQPDGVTVSDEKVKFAGEGTEFAIVYTFTSEGNSWEFRATREDTADLILGSLSKGENDDFEITEDLAYRSSSTQKGAYWSSGNVNYCLIVTDNGAMSDSAFSTLAGKYQAITK